VTVTGAGGMGKTRLALAAGAELLDDFPGGVWLAQLAAVEQPEAVADVVLSAVGGLRHSEPSAAQSLGQLAEARQFLVVLDNCEHVLEQAAACAEVITSAGGSVVLATSREALGVAGERLFPVSALSEDSSVALFVDRARAVDPGFEADVELQAHIADLCRRLDGMPLAIELAAARVRSMTVREIATRLNDRFRLLRGGSRGGPERHRTLRAAVQWSYDLLAAEEQRIFPQLSVFAGGFDTNAVVAVCANSADVMDDAAAADQLDALVGRSMVLADRRRSTSRYTLLETLRRFGEEQLIGAGAVEDLRRRHAWHYLAVAEAARRELSTCRAESATRTFDDEWDNFRLAADWFARHGEVDGALRLIVSLYWYAGLTSRYELLPWAHTATALDDADAHELWPAAAGVTAMLEWGAGNTTRAEELAVEALRVEAEHGGPERFEPSFAHLLAVLYSGRFKEFVKLVPKSLEIALRDRDRIELGITRSYLLLPYIYGWQSSTNATGDHGVALAREHVAAAEDVGCPHELAYAYLGLVACASAARDKSLAEEAYAHARRWAHPVSNRRVLDNSPLWLAASLYHDDPREALFLVRGALVSFHDAGYWGVIDFALSDLLNPLIQVGRPDLAALALGRLRLQRDPAFLDRVSGQLREQLGADVDRLRADGATMTMSSLARRLIDEIDHLLTLPA
jgi:predicted ATPase